MSLNFYISMKGIAVNKISVYFNVRVGIYRLLEKFVQGDDSKFGACRDITDMEAI